MAAHPHLELCLELVESLGLVGSSELVELTESLILLVWYVVFLELELALELVSPLALVLELVSPLALVLELVFPLALVLELVFPLALVLVLVFSLALALVLELVLALVLEFSSPSFLLRS